VSIAVCSKSGLSQLWRTAALALALLCGSSAIAQEPADDPAAADAPPTQVQLLDMLGIQSVKGPTSVDIGTGAQIKIPEGYEFLKAADAQKFLTAIGNPPDPTVLGLIEPTAGRNSWFLIFQFEDIGYIKDADKESIDADDLIATFRSGIEAGNEARREMGASELRSMDWSDKPFYDPQTNNLTWGIKLIFADDEAVNYDIRMLGRSGVMSATLVSSPEMYQAAIAPTKSLLSGFEFKQGSKYADWKPGDKVAAVGLAGLIGGGGLALAAKSGLLGKLGLLLAKGGKAIILVFVAIGAGILSLVKKLFGSRGHQDSTQQF
jgi:uncharacterized membrane-anchored protein